jgi:hypothetical protein
LLVSTLARLRSLRDRALRRERPELVFLAVWASFVILFFSLSLSKLSGYVLPALPPLAMLVALRLARAERSAVESRRLRGASSAGALVLAVLSFALLLAGAGRIARLPGAGFDLATVLLALLALGASAATLFAARDPSRRVALGLAGAGAIFLAGLMALAPRVLAERTSTALVPVLRQQLRPGDLLFARKDCLYDLASELGRPLGVVDYQGELDFGIGHLSPEERARRFPDLQGFRALWDSDRTVWLIVKERYLAGLLASGLRLDHRVGPAGEYLLFRNRAAVAPPPAP